METNNDIYGINTNIVWQVIHTHQIYMEAHKLYILPRALKETLTSIFMQNKEHYLC